MLDLTGKKYVVFDIECREDVDMKRNHFSQAQHLGIAVACAQSYDGEFKDFVHDHSAGRLVNYLAAFDYVITYNGIGFDYPLLGGCFLDEYDLRAPKIIENLFKGRTIDLCKDFHEAVGARVSLNNVAIPTLNIQKSMDGGLAPSNFRKGKILEVIQYCRHDVHMTHELFKKACAGETLKVLNKEGQTKEFKAVPKVR